MFSENERKLSKISNNSLREGQRPSQGSAATNKWVWHDMKLNYKGDDWWLEHRHWLIAFRFKLETDIPGPSFVFFGFSFQAEACGMKGGERRIINGVDAGHGEFPWQISLRFGRYGHICGGTLIGNVRSSGQMGSKHGSKFRVQIFSRRAIYRLT